MQLIFHENNISSFQIPRQILNNLNISPLTIDEKEALKLVNPFIDFKESEKSHRNLTDSQDYKSQLRFFTLERIKRNLNTLLKMIKRTLHTNEDIELIIHTKTILDEGSQLFLTLWNNQKLGTIKYTNVSEYYDELSVFDKIEYKIQSLVLQKEEQQLYDLALKFISVGDAWSGINILNELLKINKTDIYFYNLGVAYTQINKTEIAELYLNKSKEFNNSQRFVDSNYILSMLYTRHHPKYLQSTTKAEELLQEAYLHCKEKSFHKTFNRNGYALILFRKGNVEEAIKILKDGIASLKENNSEEPDSKLHESVLVYNLAQCYVAQNNIDLAHKTFKKLLALNPNYPENNLEYAKFLMNQKEFSSALKYLNIAEKLNPSIPELYSLIGLYYLEFGENIRNAKKYYELAYTTSSNETSYLYDFCYSLNLLEEYEQSLNYITLSRIEEVWKNEKLFIDLGIIRVEALLNINAFNEAKETISFLQRKYPINENLKKNQEILLNL